MGQIEDHIIAYFLIIISTIIVMLFQGFLPEFLFPGFNVAIALIILAVLLEIIIHPEDEGIGYVGTIIGIFVGYFALSLLGLSIQTLLEVPSALNMPHLSTISSILELPILSDLFVIEGLIVGMIAVKVKILVSIFLLE